MRVITILIFFILIFEVLKAQKEVKLIFTGEVNVGNNYSVKNQQHINANNLFANVVKELKSGNVTFGTLGTVLIDVDGTPNKVNMIGSNKLIKISGAYATSLSQSGFTALSLANSHISDFGIEGMQTTMNAMKHNKIEFAGLKAMQDYKIFKRNGIKYGFIAFGTSVHTLSMDDSTLIRNLVTGLDDQCDIVIVAFSFNEPSGNIQNGANYNTNKNKYLNNAISFAHTCINSGADIVFGNGHRLPQPLELYKERLIMYGLGNFCTPYGGSYIGELGAAPVIKVNTYTDGTFKEGKIVSYRQVNALGPRVDISKEAVKIIKSMTTHYFPKTTLKIEEGGNILSTSETSYAVALKLLTEANKHKGKRYLMGSMGPRTFDCSGFTSYIFAKYGIKLQRTSAGQYNQGTSINEKNIRPGDLVFFTRSSIRDIGHVGIIYSVDKKNNNFKFIHASIKNGITIDDFGNSPYYIKRYVGAKRVINN